MPARPGATGGYIIAYAVTRMQRARRRRCPRTRAAIANPQSVHVGSRAKLLNYDTQMSIDYIMGL